MKMIYQYAQHLPHGSAMPDCEAFRLYRKAASQKKLTRQEKDRIAELCYGRFGAGCSTVRFLGFAAPFHQILPRFLVKQYGNWEAYYAPDKGSLKKALSGVQEIVAA